MARTLRAPARLGVAVVAALALAGAVAPSAHGATDDTAAKRAQLAHPRLSTADATTRLVVLTKSTQPLSAVATAARSAGATVATVIPPLHAFSVSVPAGRASALSRLLAARPGVEKVTVAHRRYLSDVPNDAKWPDQSAYLDAVHAPAAWDSTHGSPSVRIAILDSGVDASLYDLGSKISGTYNAVSNSSTEVDAIGHGTGVASIAAAATNNRAGVAGAGWDTSLLAVKVTDANGKIWSDAVARGITWATDHGANVINLSFGSPQPDPLEAHAVAYAQSKGVLVVAAAGNDGNTVKNYPAGYPGVVAVGATNQSGTARTSWSTYGSWVDVAAPGASITYAEPSAGYPVVDGYAVGDGTSFAAPLVAGEAALLKAANPATTQAQLAAAISRSTSGPALGFAHGLVDFSAALGVLPPTTEPTISAPHDVTVGDDVGVVTFSTAPKVRLGLAGTGVSQLVTVVNGSAFAKLETYGLSGPQTVVGVDCSAANICNLHGPQSSFTVINMAPQLTAPADGATVGVRFTAAAKTEDYDGGGTTEFPPVRTAVRFLLDGRNVGTDLTFPYQLTVSTDGVPSGPHHLTAALCNRAGTVCDTAHPYGAPHTIYVKRLHPAITSIAPAPFSPNGDTRRDTTTVGYRLDVASKVVVSVTNSAGATVVGPRALGTFGAGSHRWVWAGKNRLGNTVPDGVYTVTLMTGSSATGTALYGHAQRTVRVDHTRPGIRGVYHSPGTVYPYLDGFQDSAELHLTLSEGVPSLHVQIFNRDGTPVRTINAGGRRPGATSVGWNGRRSTGAMVAPGSYYYRFVAQDAAGNRTTTAKYAVAVSAKRLVKHTGTKTLTALGSLKTYHASPCSTVRFDVHGWANSVGYFSDYTCRNDGEDAAMGNHAFTLPSAVRYGAVRVDAYGTQAVAGHSDQAVVIYLNSAGAGSGSHKILDSGLATYYGPTVPASNFLQGHTMRWATATGDGSWYAVKWYRVAWTYYVLQ